MSERDGLFCWFSEVLRGDRHIKRFCGVHAKNVNSSCLFRFQDPVSPHLAVRLARERTGSEVSFLF